MIYFIINVLAIFTLIADCLLALAGLLWILVKLKLISKKPFEPLLDWIHQHAMTLLFTIPMLGVLGSLLFSEFAHLPPCRYCWFSRITLYPQVLLVGTAIVRKKRDIIPYLIPLSAVGALISIYHYIEQIQVTFLGQDPFLACGSSGGVSCGAVEFIQFGYITIPVMALTAYIMILVVARIAQNRE